MDDWIEIERDEAHIKRERAKARELRKTSYFQNLFAQGICYYCKQKFPKAELTLDHIVPLSRQALELLQVDQDNFQEDI